MHRLSIAQNEIWAKAHRAFAQTSVQRRIETAVRAQKYTATLARYAGDTELQRQCQERIRALNEQYDRVSAGGRA